MRILLIGHTGTVGSNVASTLAARGHEVLGASRKTDPALDISDQASIEAYFAEARAKGDLFDAIAIASGNAPFKPLAELKAADFAVALGSKGLGQISIVQEATNLLVDNGSFTLISGILSEHPVPDGIAASTANAVVDTFVRTAAGALPRGLRINSVSPNLLAESWQAYGPSFPGYTAVPARLVAEAYVRSIEGYRYWPSSQSLVNPGGGRLAVPR